MTSYVVMAEPLVAAAVVRDAQEMWISVFMGRTGSTTGAETSVGTVSIKTPAVLS